MWLEALEQRLIAAMWTVRLMADAIRDFCGKLTSIWSFGTGSEFDVEREFLPESSSPSKLPAFTHTATKLLESSLRTYVLETKIAAGDLCDVYLAASAGERFIVKAPRDASSAADELMRNEMQVLRRLAQADSAGHYLQYLPQLVESFVTTPGRPRYNVLAWEDGLFTGGEIVTRHPDGLEGRHLAWMFKRMLAAMGFFHRQGWIHGAVLPPHMLFHAENHGLRLGGWIHAVRLGEPLQLVPAAFKAWYPPEAKTAAEPGTDIYLAAKSLVYLAEGDPLQNRIPERVPAPMRSFLQACVLESPRMRPADAWDLHEEFDQLLTELYGPPRYVRLEMN